MNRRVNRHANRHANGHSLRRRARSFFADEGVVGGAVVTVQAGAAARAEGFGYRDLAAGEPVTPDTVFGVASLTKSFTALALLLLEAEGKLELGHPLRAYLPAFRYPGLGREDGGNVTLEHAASHSSGVPPLPGLSYALRPSQAGDPGERFFRPHPEGAPTLGSYAELLAWLADQSAPPVAAPGRVVSYQNDVYALLGAVVEAAAGVPYPRFVEQRILEPLGMTRSTFSPADAAALGDVSTLYAESPEGRTFASPQWEHAPAHLATGFLKASAADLGRYLSFLLDPAPSALPVAPERVRQLWTPRAWCAPGTFYGLGLMVQPGYHGLTLVRHGGGLKGVSSHLGFVPERGLGVAVLANLEDKPVGHLWRETVNTLVGLEPDTPFYAPPGREASPAQQVRLVGRYRSLEPWGKLDVRLEGGELVAYSGEQLEQRRPLRLASGGEFFLGSPPRYDGGRWLLGDRGEVRGVQLGLRYLKRQ